MTDWNNADTGA